MITLQEARAQVLACSRGELPSEQVAVASACGRVLAADVRSDTDLPPFDRVMMDGYALRAADAQPGRVLPVTGEVAAGDPSERELLAGEAQRIMTGAPLPPGADAVLPQEWTEPAAGGVAVLRAVRSGQNVASRAEDLRRGDCVARAGETVSPLSLSLLIAAGVRELSVRLAPSVALLTSGNELVPAGRPLRRGQIRESNGPALAALFRTCGARVADLGIVRDTRAELSAMLERALVSDVVVLTGGSSVGDYDFSASVVESFGAARRFDRISVKPGKPTLFYTLRDKLIFCLPGNPVAALMTGRVLVCAALAARAGAEVAAWPGEQRPLAQPVKRDEQRDLMLPVLRRGGQLVFEGWHGSGDLTCMARADAFAFVDRGTQPAPAGTPATVFALAQDPAW